MKIQIGVLENDPKLEEEIYDSSIEAEAAAIALSYNDCPIGVWDMEDGELMAIVYQQTIFWS